VDVYKQKTGSIQVDAFIVYHKDDYVAVLGRDLVESTVSALSIGHSDQTCQCSQKLWLWDTTTRATSSDSLLSLVVAKAVSHRNYVLADEMEIKP
jgi:hypothetical protein